jgi:hypothetical protein
MENKSNALNIAVDRYHWKQVPTKVATYVEAGEEVATLVIKATSGFPKEAGHMLLAPLRGELWVVRDNKNFDANKWEKLARLSAVKSVHVADTAPKKQEGWVYLKTGAKLKTSWMEKDAATVKDIMNVGQDIWKVPGSLIGGHNTATGTLTGAALGGLAGYGLGKGMEWLVRKPLSTLFPQYFDDSEKDWWAPGGAIAGAALGGGIPLWAAAGVQDNRGGSYWGKYNRGPHNKSASAADQEAEDQFFTKMAFSIGGAGSMFRPTINSSQFVGQIHSSLGELRPPLDAVGNPVISHAIQGANPFGTKDPYGSRYAPLYTPPAAAGAMAGMVSAAAMSRKSNWVSPMDVAKIAWGAGSGALSGLIAGKVAGGLAGLNSKGQKKLQQIGLWGGLLGAAARAIF